MVHGGGLDPHRFDFPSLVLYLLAPFQAWQDEPSYLAARLTMVVLAVGAVAAAWWLGQRAYGLTAGFVAAAATAVETTHVAYSRTAVTDVPLTLGVAVALALMVSGRIELAGLAVGLAASAKYPGILLLVPLAVAAWGAWRRLAIAGGLALVAFAATSPYVLLHLGQAAGDAWRAYQVARGGWLGFEHDHTAAVAFVARIWDGFGPALIIAGAGLVLALVHRKRADLVLAAFVLAYFAGLLTVDAHFDRYVLPLVPALGALAGRFRALAPVTILMLDRPVDVGGPGRPRPDPDGRAHPGSRLGRAKPAARSDARGRSLHTGLRRLPRGSTRAAETGGADRSEARCGPVARARRPLRRRHGRRRGPGARRGPLLPARDAFPARPAHGGACLRRASRRRAGGPLG